MRWSMLLDLKPILDNPGAKVDFTCELDFSDFTFGAQSPVTEPDQHNIRPHPADPAPGNDIIIPPAKQAEKPAGPRYHDGYNVSCGNLHTGIGNVSQPAAI